MLQDFCSFYGKFMGFLVSVKIPYISHEMEKILWHSKFPYFCSNLVKLDELEKIYNDSVETFQGYVLEFAWIVQVDLNKLII